MKGNSRRFGGILSVDGDIRRFQEAPGGSLRGNRGKLS
jgi:hypothetical protein